MNITQSMSSWLSTLLPDSSFTIIRWLTTQRLCRTTQLEQEFGSHFFRTSKVLLMASSPTSRAVYRTSFGTWVIGCLTWKICGCWQQEEFGSRNPTTLSGTSVIAVHNLKLPQRKVNFPSTEMLEKSFVDRWRTYQHKTSKLLIRNLQTTKMIGQKKKIKRH